jgi:hypothetical protein
MPFPGIIVVRASFPSGERQ